MNRTTARVEEGLEIKEEEQIEGRKSARVFSPYRIKEEDELAYDEGKSSASLKGVENVKKRLEFEDKDERQSKESDKDNVKNLVNHLEDINKVFIHFYG